MKQHTFVSAQRIAMSLVLAASLLLAHGARSALGETIPELPQIMFEDPPLVIPEPTIELKPAYANYWISVLGAPEAEIRQRAAHCLAWGHENGLPGVPKAAEALAKNLDDRSRLVRFSAGRCLALIDAEDSAEPLIQWAEKDGLQAAQIVEPALARWSHEARRQVWRKWLVDYVHEPAWLSLAVRALGTVEDEASADALAGLVLDPRQTPSIRLDAADSLANIRREGLESVAESLFEAAGRGGIVDRLAAAKLLGRHDSADACELLRRMARDPSDSVATIALQRLYDLNPDYVLDFTEDVIPRRDVNLRRIVVQSLIARPSASNLGVLAGRLDDVNPSLRNEVRQSLVELAADSELKPIILRETARVLHQDSWRGLEQSLRLLTDLECDSEVERFLALLVHDRTEVFVTAAWGLSRLQVESTLSPALKMATRRRHDLQVALDSGGKVEALDVQLGYLLQLLGAKRHAPADSLLRRFIPKNLDYHWSRGAAMWALGYIHEGKPDGDLVNQLSQRLADVDGLDPEDELVRQFSAVALGRIGGEQALPPLRAFKAREGPLTLTGLACCWGVERLTGEAYTVPPADTIYRTNFFLEPLTDQ